METIELNDPIAVAEVVCHARIVQPKHEEELRGLVLRWARHATPGDTLDLTRALVCMTTGDRSVLLVDGTGAPREIARKHRLATA